MAESSPTMGLVVVHVCFSQGPYQLNFGQHSNALAAAGAMPHPGITGVRGEVAQTPRLNFCPGKAQQLLQGSCISRYAGICEC
jgi:hypothetical protein